MFRYARDVKRCGPGTKAGAPVGVVYCLSTSTFFILTLTLELDVSAFGIGDSLATYSRRSAPAASTDLWARHCKPGDCEVTGLVPETCQDSPALQQSSHTRVGRIRPSWTRWPPALRQSSRASGQEWSRA